MPNSSVSAAPDPSAWHPIDAAEADLLLAPLSGLPAVALAVSGGADSTCLLWLVADWLKRRRTAALPAPDVVVFTVDHGLRPQARAEAQEVVALCARLSLPAELLTWSPPTDLTNLQAEARHARYALLGEAMARRGIEALATAHHRDDQIETFLDRLTRGSGVYGLAAMRPDVHDGPCGLRILRPLLSVPGARLRATLSAAGIAHSEDPSNEDQTFKRVRLRRLMAHLGSEGLDPERLLVTVQRMASAAEALDAWGSEVLKQNFSQHPAGPGWLDRSVLAALPAEVRMRLLQRVLGHIGGEAYPPRFERLERLDSVLSSSGTTRQTLAGCVIAAEPAYVGFWREPGRQPADSVNVQPGSSLLWDGRFRLSLSAAAERLRIGPAGGCHSGFDRDLRAGFPAEAFVRSPVLVSASSADDAPAVVPGFSPLPAGVSLAHLPLRL
ncbi:tRNA lysidine(34) synthetase TilS [Pannonibacter sp.]|uniref:tRNA lysidine(34) synthetase TilS n=1 Tax=Pannonibacter sp. TaxID=1906786 RepID=UPI003F6EEB7A